MSTDPSKDLHKALEELKTQAGIKKPEPVKDLHASIEKLKSDTSDLQAKVSGGVSRGKRRKHHTTTKAKTQPSVPSTEPIPITSSTKTVVVKDLTKELNQLKNDANRLQSQIGQTKKQQTELKKTIKQIETARTQLQTRKLTLEKVKKTAEKVEKLKEEIKEKLEKEKRPRGSWYGERPTIDFHELTQTLYKKSKYPSKAEIRKALEEKGLAAKEDFKPKTVGEALTRLAYATAEMIEGGVTEATLGLAYDPKSNERSLALPLQVAGGLATPTALDYAFGAVLAKLGITKKGRKLINKIKDLIDKGDDIPKGLTVAEAKQFEKMLGNSGMSTSDLRKLDKKTLRTIQEVAEHYAKHPADYTAGAAYLPPEQIFYDEIINNLGWDDDIYIDFLKTYGDGLNIDKNYLAGVLLRVSINDAVKVLDNTAIDIPEDYKDRPASPGLVPREEAKTIPETGIGEEQVPEETPEQTPAPPTEKTKQTPEQTPKQTPEQVPEPPTTPLDEPTDTPEPLPSTPPMKLSKAEQQKRREMNLSRWGPQQTWAIDYHFPRGPGKTVAVEAPNIIEAMSRAQRTTTPSRYLPNMVDIKLMKGKKPG